MVDNEETANENVYAEAERDGLVRVISREEGKEILDRQSRRYFNMSGEDFIKAWESGAFEDPDGQNVMRVAMLIPFAK
jgi:hypothetical protein